MKHKDPKTSPCPSIHSLKRTESHLFCMFLCLCLLTCYRFYGCSFTHLMNMANFALSIAIFDEPGPGSLVVPGIAIQSIQAHGFLSVYGLGVCHHCL